MSSNDESNNVSVNSEEKGRNEYMTNIDTVSAINMDSNTIAIRPKGDSYNNKYLFFGPIQTSTSSQLCHFLSSQIKIPSRQEGLSFGNSTIFILEKGLALSGELLKFYQENEVCQVHEFSS